MAHQQDRELTLVKVADDVVRGEQFWIIQLDLLGGAVKRSEAPIDAATAEAQLHALGCDTWTIAQMLTDARDAFNGLPDARSNTGGQLT